MKIFSSAKSRCKLFGAHNQAFARVLFRVVCLLPVLPKKYYDDCFIPSRYARLYVAIL